MKNTIVALSTASGNGAIGIVRLSGEKSFEIADKIFYSHSKKKLSTLPSHTTNLGLIKKNNVVLDEVLATIFKGNRSYTGEPVVEFSCHGSPYIQQEIIKLCLENGAEIAQAGEFTLRAFINGKMDLSQAEAVADLIASNNETAHRLAIEQMRGGFSQEIKKLRHELLNFASLIELELDFSEEDVEFANRQEFNRFLTKIDKILSRLIDSFAMGNVIKNGIQVAIIGEPNAGKSTLLNAFLNEERAIVSEIEGTTRDTIEDEISIKGIGFRFIDTAGIRQTEDKIEQLGIEKAFKKMLKAQIILYIFDAQKIASKENFERIKHQIEELQTNFADKKFVVVANKSEVISLEEKQEITNIFKNILFISAKDKKNITDLEDLLLSFVNLGEIRNQDTIVTNVRHYNSLLKAKQGIFQIQEALNMGIYTELVAIDIREVLYSLGEITGEITTDEILGNIFSQFCIGK